MKKQRILHHIATALGLAGLVAWYYGARELGVFDWAISMMPEKYAGAGLMVGIMLAMTPGFFLWKLWTRWVENTLGITGKYYEDDFYKDEPTEKK